MTKKVYSHETDKCQPIFDEFQARSKERTLSPAYCDTILANIVYNDLRRCPKKHLNGTVAKIHAYVDRLPRSYKYVAMNSVATYEHDGKGWALRSVGREPVKVFACARGTELWLSEPAKDFVINSLAHV